MGTLTLPPRTNEKRKTLLKRTHFKKVYISEYWDAHGQTIPWGEKGLTEQDVEITECKYKQFGLNWTSWETTFNDEMYKDGEIMEYSIKGDILILKSCVGAG